MAETLLMRTVKSVNQLHFSLYRHLPCCENLVYSPLGVFGLLSLLYDGARGATRKKLRDAMNWESDPAHLVRSVEQLTKAIAQPDESGYRYLSAANAVWPDRSIDLEAIYQERVEAQEYAEIHQVDFRGSPELAAEKINSWAAQATGGMIPVIVSGGEIPEDAGLFLTTVTYFKASWLTLFDYDGKRSFRLFSGEEVETRMMTGHISRVRALLADEYIAVEIPYKSDRARRFAMTVILPRREGLGAFRAVEQNLSRIWDSFQESKVRIKRTATIRMPEFKIAGMQGIRDPLERLGLDSIFTPEADFSGISPVKPLYVSEIQQEAFIDVDKFGTVAAAVTFVVMDAMAASFKGLNLDRPFLYAISEVRSGIILFAGRVVNPSV